MTEQEMGVLLLVVVGVPAAIVWWIAQIAGKKKEARDARSQASARSTNLLAFLSKVRANAWTIAPISTRMLLQPDEKAYYEAPSVLLESRSRRVYAGGGLATRVGGVGVGGGGGTSTSVQELSRVDAGTFVLTNKRILFNGELQNRAIPISKVVVFDDESYPDAVEVAAENKQKCSVFTVPVPQQCGLILRWLRTGQFDAERAEQILTRAGAGRQG